MIIIFFPEKMIEVKLIEKLLFISYMLLKKTL